MSDVFSSVANKYKNTPSVVVLFVAAVVMFVLGVNHFLEDTYSSYIGLKSLETAFNMNVQIFDWTYWTMSLAPQIASIVFFYIYLSNTEDNGWALWISITTQIIDFLADVWYRSNGLLFSDGKVTVISMLMTFGYFTLGSEVFITVGSGLILKLYAPALYNWKDFIKEVKRVKNQFKTGRSTENQPMPREFHPPTKFPPFPNQSKSKGGGKDRRQELERVFHKVSQSRFDDDELE